MYEAASAPSRPLPDLMVGKGQYTYDANTDTYKIYTTVTIPKRIKEDIAFHSLNQLNLKIERVDGNFNCTESYLKSLIGSPPIINGTFNVSFCEISSLEGAPKHIEYDLILTSNRLTDVSNSHKHLSFVGGNIFIIRNKIKKGLMSFILIDNFAGYLKAFDTTIPHTTESKRYEKAVSIVNKHLRKGRQGVMDCQIELIDKDLEEFASI